jgi:hypothetical protein
MVNVALNVCQLQIKKSTTQRKYVQTMQSNKRFKTYFFKEYVKGKYVSDTFKVSDTWRVRVAWLGGCYLCF